MIKSKLALIQLSLLLMLAGCSGPVEEPEKAEKSAVPVTGLSAFHRMYLQARLWASDSQPLRLSNFNISQVASEGGKCGVWQATFVSNQLGKSRTYAYSVVDVSESLREGVSYGREETWTGSGQARPFLHQAMKVDSDAALATAEKNSAAYVKRNPDMPVQFLLELTPRFPNPVWRISWGETAGAAENPVFIDASTGLFLQ